MSWTLTERHPAWRWREAQPGSCKERENLAGDAKGKGPSSSIRKAESTDAGGDDGAERDEADLEGPLGVIDTDPHLAAAFAAVDAANAKAERTLADEKLGRGRSGIPSSTIPTGARTAVLDHWRTVVDQTRGLPPTLAAAIAADAWGLNRLSTRLGSAACSQLACCATAAKRAGICRACMPG